MKFYLRPSFFLLFLVSCFQVESSYDNSDLSKQIKLNDSLKEKIDFKDFNQLASTYPNKTIILAGGCFWCIESEMEKLPGVIAAVSGYTGDTLERAKYSLVAEGATLHREVVKVLYNSEKVSLKNLIFYYLTSFDSTDGDGSFYDRGYQYSPAIYVNSENKIEIKNFLTQWAAYLKSNKISNKKIAVAILTEIEFYPAEDYHQDYYLKSPVQYKRYAIGSGRIRYINQFDQLRRIIITSSKDDLDLSKLIKKKQDRTYMKTKEKMKKKIASLSPIEYRVTQKNGTEPPFNNPYWDNKSKGIYVDIVSGEPLFSSTHKYVSGTGWPSFWQAIDDENIKELKDTSHGMVRIEVRSTYGDSHLGHLFPDGPQPTGQRYCINSASLEFIPLDKMKERGYEKYLYLFD